MNGGQRPDFGGQRSDSLQIYILGISIPNARCMQNLGSIRPLGAILWPPSHIKRDFAVPLYHALGCVHIQKGKTPVIYHKTVHGWFSFRLIGYGRSAEIQYKFLKMEFNGDERERQM